MISDSLKKSERGFRLFLFLIKCNEHKKLSFSPSSTFFLDALNFADLYLGRFIFAFKHWLGTSHHQTLAALFAFIEHTFRQALHISIRFDVGFTVFGRKHYAPIRFQYNESRICLDGTFIESTLFSVVFSLCSTKQTLVLKDSSSLKKAAKISGCLKMCDNVLVFQSKRFLLCFAFLTLHYSSSTAILAA